MAGDPYARGEAGEPMTRTVIRYKDRNYTIVQYRLKDIIIFNELRMPDVLKESVCARRLDSALVKI
jgi:hypothetical protein